MRAAELVAENCFLIQMKWEKVPLHNQIKMEINAFHTIELRHEIFNLKRNE